MLRTAPPVLDCFPCIERSRVSIRAIYHGDKDDPFWKPIAEAATQAGKSFGVHFEAILFDTYHPSDMAAAIRTATEEGIDALIVTIPTDEVESAVAETVLAGIPVFGANSGYKAAGVLGVLAMVAQDESIAGKLAADRFISEFHTGNGTVENAIFVNHEVGNVALQERFEGFQKRILEEYPSADIREILIDLNNSDESIKTQLLVELGSCTADVVLNGGHIASTLMLQAMEGLENKCSGTGTSKRALIGTFDTSEEIVSAITSNDILFAISQQPHLQAVLPVMLASQYVTTGKLPHLPMDDIWGTYLSGPTIVEVSNVPSESRQKCADGGFPRMYCARHIRLGGVVHGVTTDSFWDVVFAASNQAARDMGVALDMERFEPPAAGQSDLVLHNKMAAKIRSLCDTDIDGLFVSIPSVIVAEAVEYCQDKHVPVISVNSLVDDRDRLQLLHHVGQLESIAGYEAGKALITAGANQGWCVNHEPDNEAIGQRCEGMALAFNETTSATYMGQVHVSRDNDSEYISIVENAIASTSVTWDGIGLLLTGQIQHEPAVRLKMDHPEAFIGTFDVSERIFDSLESNQFVFAVDQSPFLQGYFPIPMLTYAAYGAGHLGNGYIQSGPTFRTSSPSVDEVACEASLFTVCTSSDSGDGGEGISGTADAPSSSSSSGSNPIDSASTRNVDDGTIPGLIAGLTIGGILIVGLLVILILHLTNRYLNHEKNTKVSDSCHEGIPKYTPQGGNIDKSNFDVPVHGPDVTVA